MHGDVSKTDVRIIARLAEGVRELFPIRQQGAGPQASTAARIMRRIVRGRRAVGPNDAVTRIDDNVRGIKNPPARRDLPDSYRNRRSGERAGERGQDQGRKTKEKACTSGSHISISLHFFWAKSKLFIVGNFR